MSRVSHRCPGMIVRSANTTRGVAVRSPSPHPRGAIQGLGAAQVVILGASQTAQEVEEQDTRSGRNNVVVVFFTVSNEGLRFMVQDVGADVVGWLVERGHRQVAAAPDLVLTTGEVPVEDQNCLVVHVGQRAAPSVLADVVLPAFRPARDLPWVAGLAARMKTAGAVPSRHWEEVQSAMDIALDQLGARAGFIPSVYVLRGDRLRCVGSRGYYQILDGIPVGRAVLGEVVRTGLPRTIESRQDAEDFAVAQEGVESQVCFPLRHGAEVYGAVSVESGRSFTVDEVGWIERQTFALQTAVEDAGGMPAPSQDSWLAQAVADVVGTRERDVLHDVVLSGAQRLSGMSSAMLVYPDEEGTVRVSSAVGPLAASLRGLSPRHLREINDWVSLSSSCFTVGTGHGSGWLSYPALQAVGANCVSVHRLATGRDGLLMSADVEVRDLQPDDIQRLEILADTASEVLASVNSIEDLKRLATQDPLTGLGHKGLFETELTHLLLTSRLRMVGVMMIDIDHFKKINDQFGHQAGDQVLTAMTDALRLELRPSDSLYRIGGDEFAAVVSIPDAATGLRLAERMCQAVRMAGAQISIGLATVPTQQRPDIMELIDQADQALYAAKRSGRDHARLAPMRDATS